MKDGIVSLLCGFWIKSRMTVRVAGQRYKRIDARASAKVSYRSCDAARCPLKAKSDATYRVLNKLKL